MLLTSASVYLQHNHNLPVGEHMSKKKSGRRNSPPSHDSCPLKLSCCWFSAAYMISLTLSGALQLHLSQLIKWNERQCDRKQVAAALSHWARLVASHFNCTGVCFSNSPGCRIRRLQIWSIQLWARTAFPVQRSNITESAGRQRVKNEMRGR